MSLYYQCSLVTRGSEKADVDKEEGEIRPGKEEEKSESTPRERGVERDRGDRVSRGKGVFNTGANPRRVGGGETTGVRGIVGFFFFLNGR